MRHLGNIAGMLAITFAFCLLAVFVEPLLLYEVVSGIPQSAGTLDNWIDDFIRWALYGIVAALGAALIWYGVGQTWIWPVEGVEDSDRRPAWIVSFALPVFVWVITVAMLEAPEEGAWAAYLLALLNNVLCYYLATLLFSPASYRDTPLGAGPVRSMWPRR